ncbi:hypothetical protein BDQ17DRAFT_1544664 [Cyathus striatus]|nr:hypothetical protein BDQ17DRAFT_1544664 [Cyathus striatus]
MVLSSSSTPSEIDSDDGVNELPQQHSPCAMNSSESSEAEFDSHHSDDDNLSLILEEPDSNTVVKNIQISSKISFSSTRVFGKRDALKQLAEMPIDVWFEIFVLLEPLDLVHLTRMSKSLRNFLIWPSASIVWKRARSNLDGLPECPNGMSERGYAALLFETHCQRCLFSTSNVCWDLRIRLCVSCLDSDVNFMQRPYRHSDCIVEACPKIFCLDGDGRSRKFYYKPFLKANKKVYDALDGEEKTKWEINSSKRRCKILTHAQECRGWLNTRNDKIRSLRVNEIIKRLTDLGWLEIIEFLPTNEHIQHHELVSKAEKLTEHVWDEILPSLTKYLKEKNTFYLKDLQCAKLKARVPMLIEFHGSYTLTKPINTIIPPPSIELTINDFKDVAHGLDDFCMEWKTEKDKKLLEMILGRPPNEGELENAERTLTRATTAFKCDFCTSSRYLYSYFPNYSKSYKPESYDYRSSSSNAGVDCYIRYPRILMHEHMVSPHVFGRDNRYSKHLETVFKSSTGMFNHDIDKKFIHYTQLYEAAARDVIYNCGLDASTASIADMDKIDPIFQCMECKPAINEAFMNWRMIIAHLAKHNSNDKECSAESNKKISLATCKLVVDEAMVERVKHLLREFKLREHNEENVSGKQKEHLLDEHNKTTVGPEDVLRHIDEPEDDFQCVPPSDIFGLYND